jgi:PEGA domain
MRSLIVALVILSSAVSFADSAAVVVGGKSDARTQGIAMQAVAETLRGAGWSLAAKPVEKAQATAVGQCFKDSAPPDCVMRVVRDQGIRRVAYVLVDPEASGAGLQITARLVVSGIATVMSSVQYCDHCTDDTVTTSATSATRALLERYALETGRTVLTVKSTPQGARFSVDGVAIGATDQSIDIAPGRHVVVIEHDAFQSETRTVDATEGKTSEVSVTLRQLGGNNELEVPTTSQTATQPNPSLGSPKPEPTHRSLALPITMVAVGGAAIVGGVVALALDQSDAVAARGQVQSQYHYDTVAPGIAAIAAGAVVAGVGGYLWWRFAHTTTTPSVAVSSSGAVMSLGGSF